MLEQVTQFCERWQADQRQGHFVTMAVEEIAMSILQKAMGKALMAAFTSRWRPRRMENLCSILLIMR